MLPWHSLTSSWVQCNLQENTPTLLLYQEAKMNEFYRLQNPEFWFEGCHFLTLGHGHRDKSREGRTQQSSGCVASLFLEPVAAFHTAPTTFDFSLSNTFFFFLGQRNIFQIAWTSQYFLKGVIFTSSIDYLLGKSVALFSLMHLSVP